jgi:hypothetical protein
VFQFRAMVIRAHFGMDTDTIFEIEGKKCDIDMENCEGLQYKISKILTDSKAIYEREGGDFVDELMIYVDKLGQNIIFKSFNSKHTLEWPCYRGDDENNKKSYWSTQLQNKSYQLLNIVIETPLENDHKEEWNPTHFSLHDKSAWKGVWTS